MEERIGNKVSIVLAIKPLKKMMSRIFNLAHTF